MKFRKHMLFASSAMAAALLAAPFCAAPASAQGAPVYAFDIPSESLNQALKDFSATSSRQIVFSDAVVGSRRAPALHGSYTADQALAMLLAGSDLEADTSRSGVVMVKPKNAVAASEEAAKSEASTVEVVTVTAEKQAESSLSVPMGLTALSGEALTRTHAFRLEDFAGNVPGLTIVQTGAETVLIVRGLTTGADLDSGTAVYVDETPILPSNTFAGGALDVTNYDTYDMQRLEVLKGPQGTLYGANAAGGLLKYVTNAPDPSGFAATVEAGASTTYHGGPGFDLHGMVNIPLADDLALRVVAYDSYYSGFIADPVLGSKDVDGAHITGGRASLLWQPEQDLSVRFNFSIQDHKVNDYNNAVEDINPATLAPIYGSLVQEREVAQPTNSFTGLANVTVNWDMGFAKLVSSSSFHRSGTNFVDDGSAIYEAYTPYYYPQVYGIAEVGKIRYSTIAQEVRLSSEGDGPLQWLVGGYFTQESSNYTVSTFPVDLASHQILRNVLTLYDTGFFGGVEPVTYREYSGFANVDYHITPEFDVALGGRYSYNRQWYTEFFSGILYSGVTPSPPNKSAEGVFTWSGDARWHFTPENMLYLRVATGYEPGGPNTVNPNAPPGVPQSYSSSTTTNYEAGIKSSLLDNRLTAEIALYQIDWHSIILAEVVDGLGVVGNAGAAHTRGVEWQFNYVPIDGLTLGLNGSYTYAAFTQLDQGITATFGAHVGDRLPNIPLWQGSLNAEYERPLFGDYSGFIGMNERFTGGRPSSFVPPPELYYGPRLHLPSYGIFDLRLGAESDQYSLTLYVKNLANSLTPITYAYQSLVYNNGPQSGFVSQPRTIGITLTAKF